MTGQFARLTDDNTFTGNQTFTGTVDFQGDITMSDVNFILGTAPGTEFGTAAANRLGFYGATPTAQLTGVAVTAIGIHAALVTLGLITA